MQRVNRHKGCEGWCKGSKGGKGVKTDVKGEREK